MCRLFGLHAGLQPVDAAFWLLDAPDDLALQSHRDPDGFGIGTFAEDGTPVVDKAPRPAWSDGGFAEAAHRLRGRTFVAHVRHASTGAPVLRNTHPFVQDGRLFAHNGAIGGLDEVDRRVAELGCGSLVRGETDSERIFALITGETRTHGGDVAAGIAEAMRWLVEHVPIVSLNFVLVGPADLWAFRHPLEDELFVLRRPAGGAAGLVASGTQLTARSEALGGLPSVVVASERMDAEPGWRALRPGELLHVGPDLVPERSDLAPALLRGADGGA